MELLTPSDSSLWKLFTDIMKLQPMWNWEPRIEMLGKLTQDLNHNVVYVMIDPDYSKSKTDVFFANRIDSKETVR